MQQFAQLFNRRLFVLKYLDGFIHHRLHSLQFSVAVLEIFDFRFGHIRSDPRETGEAKHQMALQFALALFRQNDGRDMECVIFPKLNMVEAAEGRRDLILRTHVFLDDILFDIDGILCEAIFCNVPAVQCSESMHQSDGKRGTGTEARASRQVTIVVNFEAFLATRPAQDCTNRRVLNLIHVAHILDQGIDDAVLVLEERGQLAATDIALLVYGCRKNGPTIFPKPSGIVGAAPEKGYPERGARDNHGRPLVPQQPALERNAAHVFHVLFLLRPESALYKTQVIGVTKIFLPSIVPKFQDLSGTEILRGERLTFV